MRNRSAMLALTVLAGALGSAQPLTPQGKRFLDAQEPDADDLDPEAPSKTSPAPRSVSLVGSGYGAQGIGQALARYRTGSKVRPVETGVEKPTGQAPERVPLSRRDGESETSFTKRERHAERAYQKALKDYERAQRKS